jgi:hypothetical protein
MQRALYAVKQCLIQMHLIVALAPAAKFLNDYVTDHNALPTFDMINAATNTDLKNPGQLQENHYDWLMQEFETFSRHKALEAAILKSADLLEKGEYGPVRI